MSDIPEELRYTKEHEWVRVEDGVVIIGITDHAQNALTDIVYVELPEIGAEVDAMDEFAAVDSVKSSSPIFSPISGAVIEVNELLEDTPETINDEPYGKGWIVKLRTDDMGQVNELLSADDYRTLIGE
ncbi:MAG: glycine cleavage system protein H [Euryarchaeota archaeon]|nr:glycine cleavage system protein H [Euryarchaeota archaeon]|tara:strand:+ start:262 stop:645 length:384 start_codon:yes stop_codon:yes gene_type:complete